MKYSIAALLCSIVSLHADESLATVAPTPPMGWNSWDCFASTVTEAQTREHADIMADKLIRGYRYPTGLTDAIAQRCDKSSLVFDFLQGNHVRQS